MVTWNIKSSHKAKKERKSDFKTSWNILNIVMNKGTRIKLPKLFKVKEIINSKYVADSNSASKHCQFGLIWMTFDSLPQMDPTSTWLKQDNHQDFVTSKRAH